LSILLLHGQPGGATDWDRVIARLDSGVQAVAIDRPGWDGSSRACDLECNAGHALAALDRAGAHRATIAGYSLGGAVAAWIAATHPERVSRLVLIAPAANTQSLVPLDYLLAAPVLGELAGTAAIAATTLALRRRPTLRALRAFVAEQRMLIRQLPVLERLLPRISAPATVVSGTADRLVPRRSARALASQIPDTELIEIEAANHLLLWTHPGRLARILAA